MTCSASAKTMPSSSSRSVIDLLQVHARHQHADRSG